MCGIVGFFNHDYSGPLDATLLDRMSSSVKHRGPDDQGQYVDRPSGVGIGHRRLSILDLETGGQPMSNEEETIWVTFNGEIYNFAELKR